MEDVPVGKSVWADRQAKRRRPFVELLVVARVQCACRLLGNRKQGVIPACRRSKTSSTGSPIARAISQ